MSKTGKGSSRIRWLVVTGVAATLSVCAWSPTRGQEQPGTCEDAGETLAVYDCQTGLVLWSREQSGPMPSLVTSDRELCRLVIGPKLPSRAVGQCL